MANDIDALRAALFATLKGLQDKDAPLDVERARAINETAQTIINSAKVEVDYIRAAGGVGKSKFLAAGDDQVNGHAPGITGIRVHRLQG